MKVWKAVALTAGGLIAGGSVAAGIIDRRQQKKAARIAKAEGKTIHKPHGPYEKYFKRPMDFALSSTALIVLSPLMAVLALLVRVKLGSPVVFRQLRPGKDEKLFTLSKYRSLTEEKDDDGEYLPDENRLTAFGAWERSSSLDELPELWNILKGDMSLVGPRPQLVRDMVFMTPEQRRRHTIRPGLTGWAQVNGRNILLWEDRLRYDLEYVDRISFREDLKILFLTVICVLRRNGVSAEGMDTSEDLGDYLLRIGEISEEEYAEKQGKAKRGLVLRR